MTSQKSTAEAFFLGLFGGAIAGLLFSPRSGVENREQIKIKANLAKAKLEAQKSRAKDAMETANLKAKVLKDELKSSGKEVAETVKHRADSAKKAISENTEQTSSV